MSVILGLPAVWKMILYGVCTVGGSVALWYLKKIFVKFFNEYADAENTKTVTDARTQTQTADQTANQESDALKKIDGR